MNTTDPLTTHEIILANFKAATPSAKALHVRIWHDLRTHGPATTKILAERMGINLLTVRPRVTELIEMGAVELVRREGNEGVYRALHLPEIQDLRRRELPAQLPLPL